MTSRPLTVALLQLVSCGDDQAANLSKGEDACRRAAALGADIALFPEMWNIGYGGFHPAEPGARERWQAQAIPVDDPWVGHFRALAHELEMAIAVTFLERWAGAPRNSVALIDRYGQIALVYAKVHTCSFDEPEASLTPGDRFGVAALDTSAGEVSVGAMICFDREFPESARVLMLEGAELILTPNACPLELHRIAQFRGRAFENAVGVAMANYAAPQENGGSCAFSPITFGPAPAGGDGVPVDNVLAMAGEEEGIVLAHFDLAAMRAWQAAEPWGRRLRRPDACAALTAPAEPGLG